MDENNSIETKNNPNDWSEHASNYVIPPEKTGIHVAAQPIYKETVLSKKVKKSKTSKNIFGRILVMAAASSLCFGLGLGLILPISNAVVEKMNKIQVAEEVQPVYSSTKSSETTPVVSEKSVFVDNTNGFSELIKSVEPSVVRISTTYTGQSVFSGGLEQSAGSGILFHETNDRYYIATNYHVVSNDSLLGGITPKLGVSINGSELIAASLVGFNDPNDISVISVMKADAEKVLSEPVQLAKFGDSDELEVGDFVLAIGNAMGEGNTATNGIVSALDKTISIGLITLEVLQTNAAINPGNSGGPLINMSGEVIGINTAKILDTEAEGMGYSIPSNIVKPIISELMNVIDKAFLGVISSTIDADIAENYDMSSTGAVIVKVIDGSPADQAGLMSEDIIISFNSEQIETSDSLVNLISACSIGETVEIEILRNGTDYMTFTVVLGQR